MTNGNLREDDLNFVWHPFQQAAGYRSRQLVVVGGEGPYLIDDSGRKYLDAISGLWNVNLGYSERRIADAVHAQLCRMPFTSLIVFSHEPSILLARAIAERAPASLSKVFFTSGGSEGVETALKLARHVSALKGRALKKKVIAFHGAYHGTSYGALSVSGLTQSRWQSSVNLPDVIHVDSVYTYNLRPGAASEEETFAWCREAFQRALAFADPRTVAAVIVEPVIGVGGMLPHPESYLQELRRLCDQHDLLLILDEVATGFGRTGSLFAAAHFGVTPDILVLAKGMSAGYVPMGAVLTSEDVFSACQEGPAATFMHGFTYGGSPAGCVAALKCLEIIEGDGLLAKVTADGDYFLTLVREMIGNHPYVRGIRGTGLMLAFDLMDPADVEHTAPPELGLRVIAAARDRGVIIRTTYGGYTFNFAPPFICSRAELSLIVETVHDSILSTVEASVAKRGD